MELSIQKGKANLDLLKARTKNSDLFRNMTNFHLSKKSENQKLLLKELTQSVSIFGSLPELTELKFINQAQKIMNRLGKMPKSRRKHRARPWRRMSLLLMSRSV